MAAVTGTPGRRRILLSWGSALTIVGTVVGLIVARQVFVAAHRPLSWAVAATIAAVVLDPIVDRLASKIGRAPAVVLTFLAIGAVGVGSTYLVFDEVQSALDRLETAAPEAAMRVEGRGDRLGEIARDANLGERVDSFVAVLQDRVTGGEDVLRTTAGTAPTYLVGAILTVFLMTYGPRIAQGAIAQDPDEGRRRRAALILGAAAARARRAVVLTAAWAIVVGGLATGVAYLLDLPVAPAIGVSVGVISLLPHIGVAAGSIPLLLMAIGFRSGTTAIWLGVAALLLQVLDSVVVRPRIEQRAVHVGLLVPWVVAVLGYSIYGIGGAAYGVILAIFGLAVLDRLEAANEAAQASSGGTHR